MTVIMELGVLAMLGGIAVLYWKLVKPGVRQADRAGILEDIKCDMLITRLEKANLIKKDDVDENIETELENELNEKLGLKKKE